MDRHAEQMEQVHELELPESEGTLSQGYTAFGAIQSLALLVRGSPTPARESTSIPGTSDATWGPKVHRGHQERPAQTVSQPRDVPRQRPWARRALSRPQGLLDTQQSSRLLPSAGTDRRISLDAYASGPGILVVRRYMRQIPDRVLQPWDGRASARWTDPFRSTEASFTGGL